MNRPWQVWLIFAVCALIVLSAMGWLSGHAMHSDWQRSQAEWHAQREQQVSLALWRMDTKLAPLIAEEAARPYFFYDSFYTAEGGNAGKGKVAAQAEWLPSPMLNQASNVLLNFDNTLSGLWTSPQAPIQELAGLAKENGLSTEQLKENRERLSELVANVNVQQLLDRLPEQQVPAILGPHQRMAGRPQSQAELSPAQQSEEQQLAQAQQIALPQAIAPAAQQKDYGQRAERYQGAALQEFTKQRRSTTGFDSGGKRWPETSVQEGLSKPLWVKDRLLLARRIVRDGKVGVQGSWLDWPNLKRELLEEVADLFPNAELKPLPDPMQGDPSRMLAGLPVEFHVPLEKGRYSPSAALRWTLGLGWLALLVALAAVASLLWGVLALSERRAAFVSSVTHELRTPLTTFRMYSDMLARDMVPDAGKRHEYLQTLQREAERLTHLVENVLSYARLERGRGPNASEQITVGELLDRQVLRLTERAKQAEMEFELTLPEAVRGLSLKTDTGVVEQILFNLVDNAAKYAANATDRRISCEATAVGRWLNLTIRGQGLGFEQKRSARRPQAFSKTAEEAAVSAPGVGLGLALCRRLAKQLGGRLEIGDTSPGAAVNLTLPLA